jgi:hypothetical protein
MGVCKCGKETVWNGMCEDCNNEYEERMYYDGFSFRNPRPKNVDAEHIPNSIIEIESNDRKFMTDLVNFLWNYPKVLPDSTTVRLKK